MFSDLKDLVHYTIAQTKDIVQADLQVSHAIKNYFAKHECYANFCFFSEEDQSQAMTLPLILLDPIDGTHEFVKGLPEATVSMSILYSWDFADPRNQHWIYNMLNKDEVLFAGGAMQVCQTGALRLSPKPYQTFISRTEYHAYGFDQIDHPDLHITPMGSIAYKLLLLATDACDFVISVHPKNNWDIAAGSMLLAQQGVDLWMQGQRQATLQKEKYQGPLVWMPREKAPVLMPLINKILRAANAPLLVTEV